MTALVEAAERLAQQPEARYNYAPLVKTALATGLLGHESSAITEHRYIHLYDKQRTDEVVRRARAR